MLIKKNKTSNQRQVIWSLLPLIVFIVADVFLDATWSVLVSIFLGSLILAIIYITDKKIDKLLIFDIIFLAFLGIISILFNNDMFFKLKTGIMQFFLTLYIGFYAFASNRVLRDFLTRFTLGRFKITEDIQNKFRKTLKLMFCFLIPLTALVLYTAIYFSLAGSALVSIVGFVIILAFITFGSFIKRFWQNKQIESIPVVDKEGNIIGKASREYCHNGVSKALHPVVHLHILNSNREIFLQKRSSSAKVQPCKWDSSVGGHVKWNETIDSALIRETHEETKLKPKQPKMFARYIWNSEIESELVFSFFQNTNETPKINKKEAECGRWWSFDEIKLTPPNLFTPNFIQEFKILEKIFASKKQ